LKKVSIPSSFWLVLLGALVLLADQLSKEWALHHVPLLQSLLAYPFGGIPVLDWSPMFSLSINVISNTGSAWGLLREWPRLLLAVRVAALMVLFGALLTGRVRRDWHAPLVLVLAGAAGNVIDVIRYGAVIDFLHVRFGSWSFPLFNVADSAICLGVAWILVASWRDREP
jgi:signal peptidase II